jgi:hypothetical protein
VLGRLVEDEVREHGVLGLDEVGRGDDVLYGSGQPTDGLCLAQKPLGRLPYGVGIGDLAGHALLLGLTVAVPLQVLG